MKTKSYLLAAAMSAFVVAGAVAADMPVYKAPPPPVVVPPPLTWAGFYIGVNGGAVWHDVKATTNDYVEVYSWYHDAYFSNSFNTSNSKTKTGGTIGGTIGYNWQGGPWVYGIEADLNWVSAKVSGTRNFYDPFFYQGVSGTASSELTWLSTIRGRLGYSWGSAMIYATGGVAFGGVKNSVSATAYTDVHGCGDCWISGTASKTHTKTGWTAGGGFEWLFSPNWTMKAEALYVDLGNTTVSRSGTYWINDWDYIYGSVNSKISNTAVIARVGLNYKFGGY